MENGKAAVARNLINGIGFGSTEFHVLRPEPGIHAELIRYFLSQDKFRQEARRYMTGSAGQLRVPATFLSNTIFSLPPAAEQQRIVEKLDELLSQVDAELKSFTAARVKAKNYRASLLSEAVSGQLSATWRAEREQQGIQDEPASALLKRILEERRRIWEEEQSAKRTAKSAGQAKLVDDESWKSKYPEPAVPDTANLPMLPVDWCWATIDQLSVFVTSGSRGWAKFYSSNGAPFLRVGNLAREGVGLDLSNLQHVRPSDIAEGARTRVQSGDILISITADIGRIGIISSEMGEAYVNQHIALVRCIRFFNRQYLAWFLAAKTGGGHQFREMSKGATKAGLGLNDVKSVALPLPPLVEQEWIVSEIDRQLSIIASTEAAINASEHRARALRESLLQRAFSGELVPQNPQDENAQVLLERIRAARATADNQAKKVKRVPRGSNQMADKKGLGQKPARRLIIEVLNEAGGELSSDVLFDRAGFSTETVDEFFSELRDLTRNKQIAEEKAKAIVRILPPNTTPTVVGGGHP